MSRTGNRLQQRYVVAILVTTALMIWISVNEEGRSSAIPAQTAFWAIAMSAGWLQMILISRGVRSAFDKRRWPGWVLLLVAALVGAVPLSFEVRWLLGSIVAPPAGLPPAWLTYLNVAVINTVFGLVQYVLIERWPLRHGADWQDRQVSVLPNTPVSSVPPLPVSQDRQLPVVSENSDIRSRYTPEDFNAIPAVGLLSRRPEKIDGVIQYLKMEDHYLSVHTDQGNGLILHRMRDARRELQATDGRQVHKSWWVAKSAVRRVRRNGRRWTIVTTDGTEIPVGRSFESALRKADWL